MAPCASDVFDIIKAAANGDLCLLKQMAGKMDLREAKDDEGRTALQAAAAMGHLEVCRFLVEESGLDVNCTTAADGMTPVACAAAAGKVAVLRYLLDHGGNPGMPDARGTTPLHYAADLGLYKTARLLLSKGDVDVDGINDCRGSPPLQLAAGKGHDQVVQVLLEHGADPNRVTHNMFSPLLMACSGGFLKCAKLLVEAGADVNFKNFFGMTALTMAHNKGDIVELLLKAGADPNISDKDKKRTIADARPQGNQAFAKGDYLAATFAYTMATLKDPSDATLLSNRSLCWLRLGNGEAALFDAQLCKTMRPRWSKAWYREGAALSLLKDYQGAVNAFTEALKHDPDPENDEIKKALREATDSLTNARAGYSGEQNP